MRSPARPMPPRCPVAVQASTLRTTWMPCRRSQVRSSKPLDGPRGRRTTASRLTPGALRRRTAEWQLELHGLVDVPRAEPRHAGKDALLEQPDPGLGGDHGRGACGAIHLREKGSSGRARRAGHCPTTSPRRGRRARRAPTSPTAAPRRERAPLRERARLRERATPARARASADRPGRARRRPPRQ